MDLTERIGFKADLNPETGEIDFNGPNPKSVSERRLSNLRSVLAEPQELSDDPLVHKIYRMVGDTEAIINSGLKFDVTVLLPQPFCKELPKTTGHYHLPMLQAEGIPSPDFYQILYGNGLILLQREADGEVYAFEVNAGEMQHVLIPPWMGHLTVNTGKEPLVFANICVRADHLNYEPYLKRKGAAFYMMRNGRQASFVQNPNYPNAILSQLSPQEIPVLKGSDGKPFYPLLKEQTDKLGFLTQPHKFIKLFEECLR